MSKLMIRWHHALHQITGEMCKFFGAPPGPGELKGWSVDLEAIAKEMKSGLPSKDMTERYKKGSPAAIAQTVPRKDRSDPEGGIPGRLSAEDIAIRMGLPKPRMRPAKKSKRSMGRRKAKG